MERMLLDVTVLLQSCGGDEEFARELFGEYQQRVTELIVVMQESLRNDRHEDIRKAAHELKGSSLTLGAVEMANLSRTMEDACRAQEYQDLPDWIDSLDRQAALLFEHLKTLGYL